jgi:hypothetical protein
VSFDVSSYDPVRFRRCDSNECTSSVPCRDRHPAKAKAKASEEGGLSLGGIICGRSGRLDETTALECGVMVGSCCVYRKVDRGVGNRRDEGWERVTVILACSGWSRSCVRVRMKREGDEVGDAADEMCRMDVSGMKVRRDNKGSDTDSCCCCYCFWLDAWGLTPSGVHQCRTHVALVAVAVLIRQSNPGLQSVCPSALNDWFRSRRVYCSTSR